MKILIYILLSLMQTYETSENRILANSIIENPEILISIENDTNYVIKDFNKYSKKSLFDKHSEYIKKYFTDNDYILERDTVVLVYSGIDPNCFSNEIIYYNTKEDKYLQFGFNYLNQKWKMCYILKFGPDADIFLKK